MLTATFDELKDDLLTIKDWIRWAVTQFNRDELFFGHGTDNSWDEAFYLTLASLHLPPDTRPLALEGRLTTPEKQLLYERIVRRVNERIPAAYLVNEGWFAGLAFYVDKRVIVPRSPIAELIDEEFAPWIAPDQVDFVLDMCTGSGCIAIAAAFAFPGAIVDAVDYSLDALEVANINVQRYGLQDNVRLIHSNLFENVPPTKYDLIICNPPYVTSADYDALPEEYRHEPKMALEAGSDGLDLVDTLLKRARDYLSPHGVLVVEVGAAQESLMDKYPELPFTWLQFKRSEDGVFLLTAQELSDWAEAQSDD